MVDLDITFVLPNINISGGTKAVFEFSNYLIKFGHRVNIVYPSIPMPGTGFALGPKKVFRRLRGLASNLFAGPDVGWFDLKARLVRAPFLYEKYIPDGDIIVATWWETAFFVDKYSRRKGKKYYLIQHHETWGGSADQVNKSYKLGLKNIVNSSWLKNILANQLNATVEALILHSPDLDQFFPERHKKPDTGIRILIPYRSQAWKGFDIGLKAYELVRETHPEAQLVVFGFRRGDSIPGYAEFHKKPVKGELRALYNSCDIFVFPSRLEGFGMPPMEAMACRLPVVTANVGAVPDYAIPGKTALVCPPGDHQCMAECIKLLIQDRALCGRIAREGYTHIINNFNWEKFSRQLETVFMDNQ